MSAQRCPGETVGREFGEGGFEHALARTSQITGFFPQLTAKVIELTKQLIHAAVGIQERSPQKRPTAVYGIERRRPGLGHKPDRGRTLARSDRSSHRYILRSRLRSI